MSPLVLVLVGTDHHPFDRLIGWVDAVAARYADVRFVVQHGTTSPPRLAEAHDFLGPQRLEELIAEATVVVCHGGPGLISEAREAGHVPLCVPRDPRLGEHVDGHQQRFATLVGEIGAVVDVRTQEDFERELASGLLLGRGHGHAEGLHESRGAARARAAAELAEVMTVVRPRTPFRRRHDHA